MYGFPSKERASRPNSTSSKLRFFGISENLKKIKNPDTKDNKSTYMNFTFNLSINNILHNLETELNCS